MGRDPKFNLIYGLYTTALEKALIHVPQVMKGKTLIERGEYFADNIYGEHYTEWDMSKFEASQRRNLLEHVELSVWLYLLDNDPDLKIIYNLWKAKMIKKGYYPTGLKFFFMYCRGSGDQDTGLFNTILNWIAARYFEVVNGLPEGKFIVDGDDGVAARPKSRKNLVNTFKEFGFTAKLELKEDYHDVDFCSSKFIMYRKDLKFIQMNNIVKTLNNLGFFKHKEFEHCIGDYYYSLGFMYKTLYPGFPIFSELSEFLMSITNRSKSYVKTEILGRVNAGNLGNFYKCNEKPYLIDVDKSFVMSEYYCSFGLGPKNIEDILTYLNTKKIHLPDTSDKLLRKQGSNKFVNSEFEYDICEQILRTSSMKCSIDLNKIESKRAKLNFYTKWRFRSQVNHDRK
jgi:hypothetical protein